MYASSSGSFGTFASVDTHDRLGVLLAYRPIYTRNKSVAAYEAVLGSESDDCTEALPDLASNTVLDAYTSIYQDDHVEDVPSILRVAHSMVRAGAVMALPKDRYIPEIAVHGEVPAGLVEPLNALMAAGYRVALSGYGPDRDDLAPLLDSVHIIRLDLQRLGVPGIAKAIRSLYFHKAKILVEGIDDLRQFYDCVDLGVTYFQGDFLGRCSPGPDTKLPRNTLVLTQLLTELRNPNTSSAELEQIAIKDPELAFRILKVVNSAAVGLNREVSSLAAAISLLGFNELQRWVNLLLISSQPGKPSELMRSMLVRARMCEVLAGLSGHEHTMSYFIVGLLSQLDVLMDISMPDLLRQVPLSNEVKDALLRGTGSYGEVLHEVKHYQRGEFDRLRWLVDPAIYEVACRHSVNWARATQQALGGGK